ncbi:hypothetical protein [Calothrix sp. PCC 7507]|uniref:hypothetical protein n=1 Tax=Calothrix sp. PCC 7507 TaxID=99598 RepID=UPI00029ED752|nr:hypothetical protein [Calothrix sp. PCC 7507]AFY33460.1 hypothetical protein Cal7507_3047 [Calothrix sp. PCC 7507]
MKLNALVSSASLTAVMIGLTGASASAQITIQSTGTLSGTIQLPSFNPNFNNIVTRVDTDNTGTYSRNLGSKNNPNFVPVYKSDFVKVQTRTDGSLRYFVDFKGIPVISSNGAIASPILSGGQLIGYTYQGKIPGTKFQGIVQDEFGLARAFYTGIVTDPATGQQYQGTFELSGQGPRYSDRNGGASPTVFDFKSDIPGKPSVTSLTMTNVPLVRLTIKVPSNATLVTPGGNGSTPTPTPIVDNGSTFNPSPIDDADSVISSFGSSASTDNSNSSLPAATPNINSTSGNTFAVNPVVADPSLLATAVCSRDAVNCPNKSAVSKQVIGPRSRVLLRQ